MEWDTESDTHGVRYKGGTHTELEINGVGKRSWILREWDKHGMGYTRSEIYTGWNTHGVEHTEWNTHGVEYTRIGIRGMGHTRSGIYMEWNTHRLRYRSEIH